MIRPLILLLLLASPQDAEVSATSRLTGADLPAGTYRLLNKDQIEKSAAILKVFSKDAAVANVEVLLWEGDYSGDKGDVLRAQTGKLLEKAGFAWKDVKSEEKFDGNDVHLSSATKPGRRVMGAWLASKEGA